MLVKRAAEIICYIIFSVGKSACAAEAAHYRAGFTADAGFNFVAVDGTAALGKRMPCLKNRDFQFR